MEINNICEIRSPLDGSVFTLQTGFTEKQISELIDHTNSDELIKQNTSDLERFKDREIFEKRMAEKVRSYYVLSDAFGSLAGLIWFGERKFPEVELSEQINKEEYGATFAIRLYGKYRGIKLGLPFTQAVMKHYFESEEYKALGKPKLWLATKSTNAAAIKLYQNLGFHEIQTKENHAEVVMVLG
jgi:ribosomal protein S18 acetylase RimI-like enzyme